MVFEATREIQGSIVFATLIIMLVFLPLFFLSGVEGRLLVPLGFAYVVSLAASLLVAITVTPVLCCCCCRARGRCGDAAEPRFVRWLKAIYRKSLQATRGALEAHRRGEPGGVRRGAGRPLVGRPVLPAGLQRGHAHHQRRDPARHLAGRSPTASAAWSRRSCCSHPEVVGHGAAHRPLAELDEHAQDVHASEIEVSLAMKERSKEEFLAALRRDLAAVPGMNIVIGQPISHRIDHMLSGTRANIAVKIFGADLYELRRIAAAGRGRDGAACRAWWTCPPEQQTTSPSSPFSYRREASPVTACA